MKHKGQLTFFIHNSSLAGNLRLMSKSGNAKSHPVETQAYRSKQKINQNNLLLCSSSNQFATGGIIDVLLKFGGALPAMYIFGSSSAAKPRCTADRVKRASIPHEEGPCSDPIKSRARRAKAWTESIDVDSIA